MKTRTRSGSCSRSSRANHLRRGDDGQGEAFERRLQADPRHLISGERPCGPAGYSRAGLRFKIKQSGCIRLGLTTCSSSYESLR